MELARFPQRGIGHDHRPHLGELNEQDVRGLPTGEVARPMKRWTRETMVRRNTSGIPTQ